MDQLKSYAPDAEEPLRPFGIRHLHGTWTRPSVIQISGAQYDATIRSQPDAQLSYVDDDDGEEVTVGTSLELKQRLDEPIPHSLDTWATPDQDTSENTIDGNKIHIFDIQNTSGSLAVWREHEAYSSKTLRKSTTSVSKDETPEESTLRTSSAVTISDSDEITKANDKYNVNNLLFSMPKTHSDGEKDLLDAPSDLETFYPVNVEVWPRIYPDLVRDHSVGSLNNDVRANVQKEEFPPSDKEYPVSDSTLLTANDDKADIPNNHLTQPTDQLESLEKEETLSLNLDQNFTGALQGLDNYIGGFADFLDMTANTLRSMVKSEGAESTPVDKVLNGFKNILTEVGEFGVELLRNIDSNLVNFTPQSESGGSRSMGIPETYGVGLGKAAEDKSQTRENIGAQVLKPIKVTSIVNAQNVSEVVEPSTDEKRCKKPYATYKLSDSILDLDNSDPEFSARYPPLPSSRNRRLGSNMVQQPRPRCTTKPSSAEIPATARYPSLSQLEWAPHFSSSQNDGNMSTRRPVLSQKLTEQSWKTPNKAASTETILGSIRRADVTNGVKPIVQPSAFRSSSVTSHLFGGKRLSNTMSDSVTESADLEKGYTQNGGTFNEAVTADVGIGLAKHLPGAWPENRADETSLWLQASRQTLADRANPAGLDSYAESRTRDNAFPELSCRSNSPLADPYSQPQTLRRAHTVNFSNPAARLNGPFNPLLNRSKPATAAAILSKPQLTIDTSQGLANHQPLVANPIVTRSKTVHANRYRPTLRSTTESNDQPRAWNTQPLISRSSQSSTAIPLQIPQSATERPRTNSTQNSNLFTDFLHREPNFSYPDPLNSQGNRADTTESNKVNDCIRALQQMGYGSINKTEKSRLFVYAIAAEGDVEQAVEIIEEDRRAVKTWIHE